MTIPYLPGWWDSIQQNATGFVDKAQQALAPNFYANKKLQEAIQQNPQLLEQISNMDPSQRNLLAAGFGFKKQNPFGNVAEGTKLKAEKRMENAINTVTSTPEGVAELNARLTGTKTAIERQKDTLDLQKIQQDISGGATRNKLDSLKLKEVEKESVRLEKVLQQKAPDVAMVAKAVVAGKSIDPQTAERIGADPYLKATYDDYVRSLQIRMQTDASKYIASLKTPMEKQLGLDALKTQIMQAQQQLTEATNYTSGREGMMNSMSMDEATKELYKQSLQMVPVLRMRIEQLNKVYIDNLKKMGMQIPADLPFVGQDPQQTQRNPMAARPPLGSLTNQFFGPPR